MNTSSIIHYLCPVLLLGGMTACNETLDNIAETTTEALNRESYEAAVQRYNTQFVAAFGQIAPDQNWGFEPLPFLQFGQTRAAADPTSPEPGAVAAVTQCERAYVYWWFSTHPNPQSIAVEWCSLNLQHVWGQPEHSHRLANGTDVSAQYPADYGMQACLCDREGTLTSPIADLTAAGATGEQVIHQLGVSTRKFAFRSAFDAATHEQWTLQYLNGSYYLGFDYCHAATGSGAAQAADGYYNDWILKLQPAMPAAASTRRIMCEDLGTASSDWDFNDLVFDVTALELGGQKYALITVQAVGGTLPIYIGDGTTELHAMLGVPVSTPVNVHAAGDTERPVVSYLLPCKAEWLDGEGRLLAEKIPVKVDHSPHPAIMANDANSWFLQAAAGNAPHKVACPVTAFWLRESEDISKVNTSFGQWVQGQIANDAWCATSPTASYYAVNARPCATAYGDAQTQPVQAVKAWATLWSEARGSQAAVDSPAQAPDAPAPGEDAAATSPVLLTPSLPSGGDADDVIID